MSRAVILFAVAVVIGTYGGAVYLPLSEAVSTAGWQQSSLEDGWNLTIGGVTLFRVTWLPSIVTPLAQSIVGFFVPPIVGLITGLFAAVAAAIGCLVGRKDRPAARRTGVIFAGVVILASGFVLSAIAGSLLALLYAALVGTIGAGLVFGVEALLSRASNSRTPG